MLERLPTYLGVDVCDHLAAHPDALTTRNDLAYEIGNQGRFAEVEAAFRAIWESLRRQDMLEILDTLRRVGRCRAEALVAQLPAPRVSAELAADIERLETLGLLERAQDQVLSVPFDSIEILLPLARVA